MATHQTSHFWLSLFSQNLKYLTVIAQVRTIFWIISFCILRDRGPHVTTEPGDANYLLALPSWQLWWRCMLFSSIFVTSLQMCKSVDLPVCVCESVTVIMSAAAVDVSLSAAAADVCCFTVVVNSATTVVVSPLSAVTVCHKYIHCHHHYHHQLHKVTN